MKTVWSRLLTFTRSYAVETYVSTVTEGFHKYFKDWQLFMTCGAALLLCSINWDWKTVKAAETGGFNFLYFTGHALPALLALTEPQLVFLTYVKMSVII